MELQSISLRSQANCLTPFFVYVIIYVNYNFKKGDILNKLAIPFHLNNEINDDVKEFNILFYKNKNNIEKLIDFIQEYEDKRINIEFPEGIHMPTLKSVNKISDNVYCRMNPVDVVKLEELKKNNIKFFFNSTMLAYNYTTLASLIRLGVSDVYIADDLCYNMSDVKAICEQHNIQTRLILNHIPATSLDAGMDPRSPIFMPKDLDNIDKYFDVFEFDCGTPYDWTKFEVLRRVWFDKKDWHGQLGEINDDIEQDFHCDVIYPDFIDIKLNCGRRCDKRVSNPCRKCESVIEIGEILKKKNVRFVS